MLKSPVETDQPWLSDKRWRDGKVADSSGVTMIFMIVFAIFWNAIAWPVFILTWRDKGVGNFIWLIAMFPIVGAALALAAGLLILRRLKFGRSVFELETMPGQVGGYLAGTIRASTVLPASEGVRLKLQCVNRVVSDNGKNRNTHEHVRWEDEQLLAGRLHSGGGATSIPVSFAIPASASPTRPGAADEIFWRLEASAAMEGADYHASFIVPVYQTAAAAVPKNEALAAKLRRPAPPATQRASEAGIQYSKDTAGRVTIHFPAARNKHGAAILSFMGVIFLGVAVGMRYFDTGGITWIFTIVFGLFGAGMLIGALYMWFMSRTLHVRQETVEIAWRMLTLHGRRTVARSEIVAVRHKINSQAGSTPYLQVTLERRNASPITVAGGLKMADAKWVAGEIASALNVEVRGE